MNQYCYQGEECPLLCDNATAQRWPVSSTVAVGASAPAFLFTSRFCLSIPPAASLGALNFESRRVGREVVRMKMS